MTSSPSRERLYTPAELAEVLSITPRQARTLTQGRALRTVKVGRSVRVPESAVDEYIEAHMRPVAANR
ncbi:helix-turn-helix domain-containing protein [Pseudolysinimonas sp.]|uniref:helix-turn-helix domain-containing protein n=1 Tax=Pseudolysinimonas sp. TaxID=2680009 RepID=UPI0037831FE7